MAKDSLPLRVDQPPILFPVSYKKHTYPRVIITWFLLVVLSLSLGLTLTQVRNIQGSANVPFHATETLNKCHLLSVTPASAVHHARSQSDRYDAALTKPTLLRNATIWTGLVDGFEVIEGDILLDKGLIKAIGHFDPGDAALSQYTRIVSHDLAGAWVSPGIVDLHSHIGVDSSPELNGASDTNSRKGLILPWLRSLDGLNTHDDAYLLSISGGVTTALVLPGSADSIGGQGFTIKLRPTTERSSSSLLLEPPYNLNGSDVDSSLPLRWRQMKHACGENPRRVYSGTRMDNIWALRQAYETARKIKLSQDDYCSAALAGKWDVLGDTRFPEDLQWESLVDVLRGRVKIHNHCYEAVDLDGMVRLTNEFKFPIAAFHHAHETYLVPDLLKKTYGGAPAIAMFATNARYKREAFRGSEFASRILADNGLNVIMKSDHPVLNSRHLLYEAQQAHYYGLSANLALAAVTSTPATAMGLDYRIGYIKTSYDADLVVWDSHPLALGATPKQVYIDGIPQLEAPHTVEKPPIFQRLPKTPNFDKEAADTIKYEGLPPLEPTKSKADIVVFSNVSSVFLKKQGAVREVFSAAAKGQGVVIVDNGVVVCTGTCDAATFTSKLKSVERVDLHGGSISPALVSFGSPLGLQEISGEPSTYDGVVFDAFGEVPAIIGGDQSVIRAVDGLQYGTRDALLAYRAGVTVGITAPKSNGFLVGLSTSFSTGAAHSLEKGAVLEDVTALHITIGHSSPTPSVSTQIASLRRLLKGEAKGGLGNAFEDVVKGNLPLVVNVNSADVIASLITLKQEIEAEGDTKIKLILVGAAEAHLLAKEIGESGVGVIIAPIRPFPKKWESRRILAGPPLTKDNAIAALLAYNVTVALGTKDQWSVRSTRFDVAWAALEANLSKEEAFALASVNIEALLGVENDFSDLVATSGGGLLDFESKVVGVISPRRGVVDFV